MRPLKKSMAYLLCIEISSISFQYLIAPFSVNFEQHSFVRIYESVFIPYYIKGYLGCFQVLTTVNELNLKACSGFCVGMLLASLLEIKKHVENVCLVLQ